MSVRGRKKVNAGKPYGETGSRRTGRSHALRKNPLADAPRIVGNGTSPLDTGAKSPAWKR